LGVMRESNEHIMKHEDDGDIGFLQDEYDLALAALNAPLEDFLNNGFKEVQFIMVDGETNIDLFAHAIANKSGENFRGAKAAGGVADSPNGSRDDQVIYQVSSPERVFLGRVKSAFDSGPHDRDFYYGERPAAWVLPTRFLGGEGPLSECRIPAQPRKILAWNYGAGWEEPVKCVEPGARGDIRRQAHSTWWNWWLRWLPDLPD
jgi:hypothetical protein